MSFIKKHIILCSVIVAILIGWIVSGLLCVVTGNLDSMLIMPVVCGMFLIYPAMLTLINILSLAIIPKDEMWRKKLKKFEYITWILGALYSMWWMELVSIDIRMGAVWSEVLYNSQVHQPVWEGALPTVITLCVVGIGGYLLLSMIRLEKMPPLLIVLSISAMYLGIMECILWCIQICDVQNWILCIFPMNCIIIMLKTIRYKIAEWNTLRQEKEQLYEKGSLLYSLNRKLCNAAYWPLLAFILMWPLLGIILCILVLFGQKPDAVIKAWTETADWRLSQKIPPQNIYMDEHYLCTVAAGGHAALVKPIRMGERHGHRVVVNRQLCIANAFEQILEERTPRFHRIVRHIYDAYGFPVARLIRTKLAADVVYIMMKPAEWLFLMVIYLCDVHPENRIAVQYLPVRERSGRK